MTDIRPLRRRAIKAAAEIDHLRNEVEGISDGISALIEENARLCAKVRQLTQLLDDQNGTPCEQIRHQQEIERLRAALSELLNAFTSEDRWLNDDLVIERARCALGNPK